MIALLDLVLSVERFSPHDFPTDPAEDGVWGEEEEKEIPEL